MAKLQRTLDGRWETGSIRSGLSQPSFGLLVRFLRNPDPDDWKRAVFTQLLSLFQPADMQSAALKREFTEAAAEALPSMVQEVIGALPEETAFAGRGSWRDTPPAFAQVYLAGADLPVEMLEADSPDESSSGVRVATMHRVKGLEFDRMVIVSMNEDSIPRAAAVDVDDGPERTAAETTERALMYVAATRARKELILLSYGTPSRFLN